MSRRTLLSELYVSDRLSKIEKRKQRMLAERRIDRLKKVRANILIEANRLILMEKLNEDDLQRVTTSLKNLANIIRGYGLTELENGIKEASKQAAALLTGGVKGFATRLKQMLTGNIMPLAKITAFEASVTTGLRQLPSVVDLLQGAGDIPDDQPIIETLPPDQLESARGVIIKALSRPLQFFKSKKIPFVGNITNMVDEIMSLTPTQIRDLANKTRNINRSLDDETLKQIADIARKDYKAGTGETSPHDEIATLRHILGSDVTDEETDGGITVDTDKFVSKLRTLDKKSLKTVADTIRGGNITFL